MIHCWLRRRQLRHLGYSASHLTLRWRQMLQAIDSRGRLEGLSMMTRGVIAFCECGLMLAYLVAGEVNAS